LFGLEDEKMARLSGFRKLSFPLSSDHATVVEGTAMRRILLSGLFCASLLAIAADKPSPTPKQFLESWAEAWKSNNVDKLLSFYENSKDVVTVSSSGHLHKGTAEVRKMYEAAFGEATWERVTLEGLEIRHDGNVAWGTCRFKADFAPKAGKEKLIFASQGSFVLHKQGESWKIVLEHYSPIADVPRVKPRND
jgi:uncharacterized protein (TIGR02246 family)